MFIDSHSHLSADPLYEDIEGIIERAQASGVKQLVNICTDKLSLKRGLEVAERYRSFHNVGATTPHDVEKEGGLYFPLFEEAARTGKLVAIGETGLDYHYAYSPKEVQRTFLSRYLKLAEACSLPVVIHCRDAFADLLTIADRDFPKGRCVIHCFTGTLEEAEACISRGWLLSFSGIVTFKKSDALRAVVKEIPLSQILIETDSPYLAPQTRRGKVNEPAFVVEIAEMLAEVKKLSLSEVARVTSKNAATFFALDS